MGSLYNLQEVGRANKASTVPVTLQESLITRLTAHSHAGRWCEPLEPLTLHTYWPTFVHCTGVEETAANERIGATRPRPNAVTLPLEHIHTPPLTIRACPVAGPFNPEATPSQCQDKVRASTSSTEHIQGVHMTTRLCSSNLAHRF